MLPHVDADASRLEASGSTTLPLGQRGGEERVMHWIGSSGLGESMTLLQLRPVAASRVRSADLTRREAEVLSWLAIAHKSAIQQFSRLGRFIKGWRDKAS